MAGIVLNRPAAAENDPSVESNRRGLSERAVPPILAEVMHRADAFDAEVDWSALAQ